MPTYPHPNIHPDSATLKELSAWAENHDDDWVRKLGAVVNNISDSSVNHTDINEFIDELKSQVNDLESSLNHEVDEHHDTLKDLDYVAQERDALRLELSKEWRRDQNTELKARVFNLQSDVTQLNAKIKRDEKLYLELQDKFVKLTEKYNTFQIIST